MRLTAVAVVVPLRPQFLAVGLQGTQPEVIRAM